MSRWGVVVARLLLLSAVIVASDGCSEPYDGLRGDTGRMSRTGDDDDDTVSACAAEGEDCDRGETCCDGFACSPLGTCQVVFTCTTDEECRAQNGTNFRCNTLLGQCEQKRADACAVTCSTNAECTCAGYVCDSLLGSCSSASGGFCNGPCLVDADCACLGYGCDLRFGYCDVGATAAPCGGACSGSQVCDPVMNACVFDCRQFGCPRVTQVCDRATGLCGGCAPQCSGRACGADGRGGQCGTCPTGNTCDTQGQCVAPPCTTAADCLDPLRPICEPVSQTCVACLVDTDCADPSRPVCDGLARVCVGICGTAGVACAAAGDCCTSYVCAVVPTAPVGAPGLCYEACDLAAPACTDPVMTCSAYGALSGSTTTGVCCDPRFDASCT